MQAQVEQPAQKVLQRLVALHGITSLLTELGDFLIDGHISPAQVSLLPGGASSNSALLASHQAA